MPEDAGKLEVEYVVISDAAVRRLERLQKQMDKVEESANKQGDAIEMTYKNAGKAMAVFGAVATGVLYGIVRASSYSAMWLDQISHQMTRIADKILEITGMDEVIETFIKILDNLADELTGPEETDFWKRLLGDWENMSLKAKALTIVVGILTFALSVLAAAKVWGIISAAGSVLVMIATRIGIVAIATKAWAAILVILKGALLFITSTVGIVAIAITALILILGYLWSKTDHGIAQIKALGNVWGNFKDNISDIGWVAAITTALRDIGTIMIYEVVYMLQSVYNAYVSSLTAIVSFVYNSGKWIINALVDGMDNMFPGFRSTVQNIYNKFLETFNRIITMAYKSGNDIISYLVAGLYAKIPGFENAVNVLKNIWSMKGNEIVVSANEVGAAIPQAMINNAEAYGPVVGVSYDKLGNIVYDSFVGPMQQIPNSVCDEMAGAYDCVSTGVDGINSELDRIITDIQIKANLSMAKGEYVAGGYGWKLSGWKNTGGSGGGSYVAGGTGWKLSGWKNTGGSSSGSSSSSSGGGGWKLSGWKNSSATGGHVMRTGLNTVHQGEDIINLKSLLSGIKSGENNKGDIVINPVINITSGGSMSDPFEANRVADVVSRRMGEELRRITTNI